MVGYIFLVASGGPDGYGYMWFDQGDGVPYEWYDLGYPPIWQYQPIIDSADATLAASMWIPTSAQTRIIGGDEAYNNTQTLPFDVTFFNTTYSAGTNFTISTNGWMALASYTSAYWSNTSFPNPALPNHLIAPFWDDLSSRVWVGVIPDIRAYWPWWPNPSSALVVTWDSAKYYNAGSPDAEFQVVILNETDPNGNNVIVFIYKTPFTTSMTGSIGFENSTGTMGNAYTGALSVGTTPDVENFNPGVVIFNSFLVGDDPDVVVLGSGDDVLFSATLPFDVKFYGVTYTAGSTVRISTNGFLSFASITLSYSSNDEIPSTSAPNAILAIWWDDNVVLGSIRHKVIGSAPNRKWVILFDRVRRFGFTATGGNAKFQIIIYEETSTTTGDNKIVFSYNTTDFGSRTPDATIGIENQGGNTGLPYTGSRITGTQPNISAILPNTSILFQTDDFTSISEASRSVKVSISKDHIKVDGKAKVEIYDVLGKRVFSSEVENSKISLKDLPKGVYFVKVGQKTYKIVR
ncbi:MAG: nidogen-like domain-containing protein [Candidatus Caldipriscus sp.]